MKVSIDRRLAAKLDLEDKKWANKVRNDRKKKFAAKNKPKEYSYPDKEHKDSHGESIIADWLRKHGIQFVQEKEFPKCVNNKTGCRLKFDFFVPKFNTVIEFDGRHHFEVGGLNKSKEDLDEVIRRDKRKDDYCSRSGIYVIRIPYTKLKRIHRILTSCLLITK